MRSRIRSGVASVLRRPAPQRSLAAWEAVRAAGAGHVLSALVLGVSLATPARGQQRGDEGFVPDVPDPTWEAGAGPLVLVDEAHHNYHTVTGRYEPFAELLRADGWRVAGSGTPLTPETLASARVLVIANALNAVNVEEWSLPTPSAFTETEIDALRSWVEAGGALLLIADHMPFPGAAATLAAAFGFEMRNGFAGESPQPGILVFRRSDGSLASHAVTDGRRPQERIDSVATFVGQGFRVPERATSLLTFRPGSVSLEPDTAWQFHDDTPRIPIGGFSQGAVVEVGSGRVAVWGEAAGFTAQVRGADGAPMGLSLLVAGQNARLLLNLVRWLALGP